MAIPKSKVKWFYFLCLVCLCTV